MSAWKFESEIVKICENKSGNDRLIEIAKKLSQMCDNAYDKGMQDKSDQIINAINESRYEY